MFWLKWNLWFFTVTFVCWNLSEVSAITNPIKEGKVRTEVRESLGNVQTSFSSPTNLDVENKKQQTLKIKNGLKQGVPAKTMGYAAEWEHKGNGLREFDEPSENYYQDQSKVSNTPSRTIKLEPKGKYESYPSPSRRIGPGTWMDSNGYWWLFGGQGPSASIISNETISPNHYLSDLWVYGPPTLNDATISGDVQNPYWRLMYRPEYDGESPTASHPEDVLFPLLCGNREQGHLSLFGGKTRASTRPHGLGVSETESHNSLFTEDSAVWLYDLPKSLEKGPRRTIKSIGNGCNWSGKEQKERSCNGTGGLKWTSYICCDACLPDGISQPTFEFCPQFSREPILWCNQDSLMAFQIIQTMTSTKKESKWEASSQDLTAPSTTTSTFISKNKIPKESQQRNITEKDSYNTTQTTQSKVTKEVTLPSVSHISQKNITLRDFSRNKSNSHGTGQLGKVGRESGDEKWKNVTLVSLDDDEKSSPKQHNSTKMRRDIINSPVLEKEINTKEVESDEGEPNVKNSEEAGRHVVNWWKFDLTLTEWMKMPEVNINAENAEQVRSGNCRSVSDQEFLYILCPTKTNLLDRSVLLFDPKRGSVQTLGTIQLNNAFHDKKVWHLGRSVFHAVRSDNQTVILLAYHKLLDLWIHEHSSKTLRAVENIWKGSSLHAFQHTFSFYKLSIVLPSTFSEESSKNDYETFVTTKTHSLYMVNPRSKLFTFDDPFPDGHFQITIVTDRSIFLPSRDAPQLIDSTTESVNNFDEEGYTTKTKPSQAITSKGINKTLFYSKIVRKASTQDKKPTIRTLLLSSQKESSSSMKETHINKSNVPEGLRIQTVTGLLKAQGSIFNSSKTHLTTLDPFTKPSSKRDVGTTTTERNEIPDQFHIVAESSQSKANPTQRNYNKTNNSQMKSQRELDVGGKRRILGIKRTIPEELKIEFPKVTMSNTNDSKSTIRSKVASTSLPVNNESIRKPLSTFGESPANSRKMPETALSNSTTTKRTSGNGDTSDSQNKSTTTTTHEVKSYTKVNLSGSPEASELKVEQQPQEFHSPLQKASFEPLQTNLETRIDWIQSKNTSHQSSSRNSRIKEESDESRDDDDRLNLKSNYVSHSGKFLRAFDNAPRKNESNLMIHYANVSSIGNMHRGLSPLTYGSSEITIDTGNEEIIEDADDNYYTSYSTFGSLLFFSLSLSIFATFGLIIFVKRCVRCPRRESVLLKEPPIRYAVVPDELSFPIV